MDCPKCGYKNKSGAVMCAACYFDLQSSKKPVIAPVVVSSKARSAPPAAKPPESEFTPSNVGIPASMPGMPATPASIPQFDGSTQVLKYAGLWSRIAAAIVDGIILTIALLVIIILPIVGVVGSSSSGLSVTQLNSLSFLFYAVVTLVEFLYFIGFYASRGATPGKMALGLKIVRTDGTPISVSTAVVRVLIWWILSILGCVTFFITCLTVAFMQKKQGIHDMAAGTVVIKVR